MRFRGRRRRERGKKEKKSLCCISNPCFVSFWLWNEGPFKLLSSTASTELSSSGGLFYLKYPSSFMMTPPFIMNTCCFGPKLSLFFFLFPLPFKFGFKCAHITLTHTSSVQPVNAGWRVGGIWKKEVGECCWLCPVWGTLYLQPLRGFRSLALQANTRALKAALKCGRLWVHVCVLVQWNTKIHFPIRVTDISFLHNAGLDLFLTEFSDSLQLALSVGEPSSKNTEIMWSLMSCLA